MRVHLFVSFCKCFLSLFRFLVSIKPPKRRVCFLYITLKMFRFQFSEKIYYCTVEDDREAGQFVDFCKTFLPDHTVERINGVNDKDHVVLVFYVPIKNRLDFYKHFSEKVKNIVKTCGLDIPGKAIFIAYYAYLSLKNQIITLMHSNVNIYR